MPNLKCTVWVEFKMRRPVSARLFGCVIMVAIRWLPYSLANLVAGTLSDLRFKLCFVTTCPARAQR